MTSNEAHLDQMTLANGTVVATACPVPHVSGDPHRPTIPTSTLGVVVAPVDRKGCYCVDFSGFGQAMVWDMDLAVLDLDVVEQLARISGDEVAQIFAAQQTLIRDQQDRISRLRRELCAMRSAHAQIQEELTEQVDYEAARADGLQAQLDTLIAELMEEGRAPDRLALPNRPTP